MPRARSTDHGTDLQSVQRLAKRNEVSPCHGGTHHPTWGCQVPPPLILIP